MAKAVRVLMLEDEAGYEPLVTYQLQTAGLVCTLQRVDTREAFTEALHSFKPDLILADHSLPFLGGWSALDIATTEVPDVPFIFVSGTSMGEEKAIEGLQKGAVDYVSKDRLSLLGTVVARALHESEEHRQRKQAEQELRNSQEIFRLITENVDDLIAVLDLDGRRLYNSPSYKAILGDPDSLKGGDSFQEIHPEDREKIKQIFLETVATGTSQRAEFRFIGKDGSLRHIESHSSVIRDSARKVSKVIVVSRDVTERKRAELEKENLADHLREAQRMESIGTLAGGLAHDFNNILSIILGYAAVLRKPKLQQEEKAEALHAITKAAQRGATLVKQLMTFAWKTDVHVAPVDLKAIVEELIGMMRATFPKTMTFSLKTSSAIPLIVADAGQLNQALLNLCVNSRDAMPRGGKLTITVETVRGESLRTEFPNAENVEYIALHVGDTGAGMDEATRHRIFEPFFTTKEHGKGTGLGLAVVYGVVKGHHGFISVESEPNAGTTFRLYFPVRHPQAAESGTEEASETLQGANETILLVEDEEMLLTLVSGMLSSHGYNVLIAHDGREAVEVFRNHGEEIALVLSDLGLPELGGWEAFLRMREMNPQVKGIFATGYLDDNANTDMREMGIPSVIRKPYVLEEILKAVRSAIDSPFGS